MPELTVHVAVPPASVVVASHAWVPALPYVIDQLTVPASGIGVTLAVRVTELPVLGVEGDPVTAVVVGAAT